MNSVQLMGRLTREPDIKHTQAGDPVARYTLAVDRGWGEDKTTDFISCVAFKKAAEFVERYVHKGTKLVVSGSIKTGSYSKQDGTKVYTTDVIIDRQEFAESKQAAPEPTPTDADGFARIPDGVDDAGLPFN